MKIIFKQSESDPLSSLSGYGIRQCYFKKLTFAKDKKQITKKRHHHNGFEIHIIENGRQIYEFDGRNIKIDSGQLLLVPPLVQHRIAETQNNTEKYSITFSVSESSILFGKLNDIISEKIPIALMDNIRFIISESQKKDSFWERMSENRILECILMICRQTGIGETEAKTKELSSDPIFTIAKQYIADNICRGVKVAELADYCALSCRQLSRLFNKEIEISPSEFIRGERGKHIEKLLADPNISLKQISEIMNFENEFYFNAFFKKYSGMPPGTYRRSIKAD